MHLMTKTTDLDQGLWRKFTESLPENSKFLVPPQKTYPMSLGNLLYFWHGEAQDLPEPHYVSIIEVDDGFKKINVNLTFFESRNNTIGKINPSDNFYVNEAILSKGRFWETQSTKEVHYSNRNFKDALKQYWHIKNDDGSDLKALVNSKLKFPNKFTKAKELIFSVGVGFSPGSSMLHTLPRGFRFK